MKDAELFREMLHYFPLTGVFAWKKSFSRRIKPGALAGTQNKLGYIQIGLCGKTYLAHRVAWLMTHGEWPCAEIDHKNCIKDDNRLDNLRLATRSQNGGNRPAQARNKHGNKGVHWSARDKVWRARIVCNRKIYNLGSFSSKEEANGAYSVKADELFGEFAKHE